MTVDEQGTKLVTFLHSLRSLDFPISTQQYLTVYQALIALAQSDKWPSDLDEFRLILAPILCTNPKDQEYFYTQFDRWMDVQKRVAVDPHSKTSRRRAFGSISVSRRTAVIAALVLVAIAVTVKVSRDRARSTSGISPNNQSRVTVEGESPSVGTPHTKTSENPTEAPSQDATIPIGQSGGPIKPSRALLVTAIMAGSILFIVGLVGLYRYWLARRRAQLAKWTTALEPEPTLLARRSQMLNLYPIPVVQRIATQLLRHRPMLKTTVDPQRTIAATINKGGLFTLIKSEQLASPVYTFLVHRISAKDQQAALYDLLTDHLHEWNIAIDVYYYEGDPRACYRRPLGPRTVPQYVGIEELAASHLGQRLGIFGDSYHFVSSVTGQLVPWAIHLRRWTTSVLFHTPSSRITQARAELLNEIGTNVVPAGFGHLAALAVEESNTPSIAPPSDRYPTLLQGFAVNWMERRPPSARALSELIVQLRDYLGIDGMLCLRACAVYPAMLWDLTLHFVQTLPPLSRRGPLLEKLVALPWFRQGLMPDWLRLRLVGGLCPGESSRVRDALERFLESLLQGGALDRRSAIVQRRIALRSASATLTEDYVFVSFILGHRIDPLKPVISTALGQAMLQRGQLGSALLLLTVANVVSIWKTRLANAGTRLRSRLRNLWLAWKKRLRRFKRLALLAVPTLASGLRNPELKRIFHLLIIFACAFVVIDGRLFWLQVIRRNEFVKQASYQSTNTVAVSPVRGNIYDRNGNVLATSESVDSVFAVPSEITDIPSTAKQLAEALQQNATDIENNLRSSISFVWVSRTVDSAIGSKIRTLNLRGIYFQKESKRSYPKNGLGGNILGFVGPDGRGIGGVEQEFDTKLSGTPGAMLISKTPAGQGFGHVGKAPIAGEDLVLSLDAEIQNIAERELQTAVADSRAEAGTIVVENPHTGELLALASWPLSNSGAPNSADPTVNQGISTVYEPGSLFTLLAVTVALEERVAKPDETFDCGDTSGMYGLPVRDIKKFGALTVAQVLEQSSAVCTVKLSLRVGPERFNRYINSFGFNEPTGIELPNEAHGMVEPLSRWSSADFVRLSQGRGLLASPVQLISLISSISNDGIYLPPRIAVGTTTPSNTPQLIMYRPPPGKRVISPATAAQVKEMMEGVVLRGTGKKGILDGYTSGGKTGTTWPDDSPFDVAAKYRKIVAFGGFAPVKTPAVNVLVVLYSPAGTSPTGGDLAAPVFARVMEQVLTYLGVPHDVPMRPSVPAADH